MKKAIARTAPPRACAIILMLLIAGTATAQSTRPTTAPAGAAAASPTVAPTTAAPLRGLYEKTALRTADQPAGPTTNSAGAAVKVLPGIEPWRVILAGVIVIALIFVLRWFGRRFFPAAAVGRSSSAIRVLSRNVVAPKQQFLLLQVGRRVVVVGDCGTSMTALAEITDPEEVASLIGQIDAEKPESLTHAFGNLFGSARKQFDEAQVPAESPDDAEDEPELEIAGAGGIVGEPEERDPEVVSARGELRGLMDKVKMLTQQFHRS